MPTVVCNGKSVELVPVQFQPILEPVSCPACGAPTSRENRGKEGANVYCTNPDCSAAKIRKIGHWCGTSKKGIGILDIGDTMIQALWDANLVRDPADLYTMKPEQFADVQTASGVRIGLSRAETVVANIQAKSKLPLHVFLGALGIDLLGSRRAQLLIEAAAGRLDTIESWLDDDLLRDLDIAGMRYTGKYAESVESAGKDEGTTRAAIRSGIDLCRPLISKLMAVGVTVLPATPAPTQDLVTSATEGNGVPTDHIAPGRFLGLSFCFTGTRECIADVQAQGGAIHDGVRKGTSYLVYKPTKTGAVTSKAAKAEKLGTVVITLDLLKEVLAGTAQL